MSGFDHHDPEIEQLMWSRAHGQGEQLVATNAVVARHHERMDDPAYRQQLAMQAAGIDIDKLVAALTEMVETFQAAMAQFASAISSVATNCAEFAERLVSLIPERPNDAAPIEKTLHGHAAMCPKHGPTVGGFCRKCRR